MSTFTQAVDFLNYVTAFGQQARVQVFLASFMSLFDRALPALTRSVQKLADLVVAWCAPAPARLAASELR